ncbi:hypothetical protein [Bacillus rhizoplanae]|uniref:hypothetical protein n=1 Tax=Bacillus rhizoplanae TaxID=2880966 RepID=UPI003D199BD7
MVNAGYFLFLNSKNVYMGLKNEEIISEWKIEAEDVLFWNKDYNVFQIEPKLVELCKEKGINSTYGVMG